MKKILLSLLMVLLAVPAFAIGVPMPEGHKLDLYGSLRLAASYSNASPRVGDAVSDFNYAMQSNSRFGVRYSGDGLFANVEFNFRGDQSVNNVNAGAGVIGFRQLFAGYNFENGFTITAGQKTTLVGMEGEFSDIAFGDNGLGGFGASYDVRRPLVMFSYANIDLAVVQNTVDSSTSISGFSKSKDYLPRFELAYNLKFDAVKGKIFFGYGLYSEKQATTNAVYNINSLTVGTILKGNPTKEFNITGGVFYGMNSGMFGNALALNAAGTGTMALIPSFNAADKSFYDINSIGAAVQFTYNFNAMVGAVLGGGFQYNTSDAWVDDLTSYAVFAQVPLKFNKYLSLRPQVGYYASSQTDTSAYLLAGAQLRFDF